MDSGKSMCTTSLQQPGEQTALLHLAASGRKLQRAFLLAQDFASCCKCGEHGQQVHIYVRHMHLLTCLPYLQHNAKSCEITYLSYQAFEATKVCIIYDIC